MMRSLGGYHLPRHTLDSAEVRAAVLGLVVHLGQFLHHRSQADRALKLVLKFADGATWETTCRLVEPSAHDEDLRTLLWTPTG